MNSEEGESQKLSVEFYYKLFISTIELVGFDGKSSYTTTSNLYSTALVETGREDGDHY